DCFVGIPERKLDAHKYSAGKVLVIAGSDDYPGAAKLTANSAIVSGAGAVILAVPDSIRSIIHSGLEGVVVESYPSSGYFDSDSVSYLRNRIDWADVIAVGPGLGREPETLSAVLGLVSRYSHKKFVIDADALYAFDKPDLKKFSSSNFVFTPHSGEFNNLMELQKGELNKDILASGRKFVNLSKGYLLLKGAPSIIFNPSGEAFINSSGNPGLAKFGSGDVLTGMIAAFIAQSGEIEKSLVSACYVHGLAADLYSEDFSEINLTAERLIDYIPNAVKFIHDTFV
ncbi:MAG: NAD(P)H-hydrate dehydratase, partial [Ignavibacteria bacterium]